MSDRFPTAAEFALTAYGYRNSNIPYSVLDCQAFVEQVLADCGVHKNWRGSNAMWRNALSWRGTIEEAKQKFGKIPVGAWLFTIKWDGGEDKSLYKDGQNAAHVGIYTGMGRGAMHSTTGGVQECDFPDGKRWNYCGLCKYIDYEHQDEDYKAVIKQAIDLLESLL